MTQVSSYAAGKQRLTLIEATVGGPEEFIEAWQAPHATVKGIRERWPLSDYDARAYAQSLGLASRPGRIVAVEAVPETEAISAPPITIPLASVERLVDTLAEAVADKVFELLEERMSRKARRGLFGTGR